MMLPKKIRFWLFKLKAYNVKQKFKVAYFTSAIWLLIVAVIIFWITFDKINGKPAEPIRSDANQEPNAPIQVLLFNDENTLKDLPKEINSKNYLESLFLASQNSDLNIDADLDKINF